MSMDLIAITAPQSPAAEAYRTLRTNLEFVNPDAPPQMIVFTAPSREEDTAHVVANLAVTIAQTGRRVLAVEGDLRHPRLHEVFGVPSTPGITEMVQRQEDPDAGFIHTTEVAGLHLLPAGALPSSPADILDSKWLTQVWQTLRDMFDVLLVNTPPVLAVADAAILAPRADGVILVLKAGTTKRSHALQAKERLARVRANLLGTVLLDAPYDKAVQRY